MKIKTTKRIHVGWKEWQELLKSKSENIGIKAMIKNHPKGLFGKWQYIYESKRGKISLIELPNYDFVTGEDVWEILELSKNHLLPYDDVKRFSTKKQAEKMIRGLLG
jgi:hypothetical protein